MKKLFSFAVICFSVFSFAAEISSTIIASVVLVLLKIVNLLLLEGVGIPCN